MSDSDSLRCDLTGHNGRNRAEELTSLWQAELDYEDAQHDDHWGDLGGDSLGAVAFLGRLRIQGYDLSLREFLRNPTLGGVIAHSSAPSSADEGAEAHTPHVEELPVTASQLEALRFDLADRNRHVDSFSLDLNHPISQRRLRQLASRLAAMHPALTSKFSQRDGIWIQVLTPSEARSIDVDFHPHQLSSDSSRCTDVLRAITTRFDIEVGALSRLVGWCDGEDVTSLTFVFHHLAGDGFSIRILQDEINDAVASWHSGATLQEPSSDHYESWLAVASTATTTEQRESPSQGWQYLKLQQFGLDVDLTGSSGQRGIPDRVLSAIRLAVADSDEAALDVIHHGREDRPGYPSLANTVGWFSLARDSGSPLDTVDMHNRSEDGEVSKFAYLNYRGSLVENLRRPMSHSRARVLDVGTLSDQRNSQPYRIRLVVDRFGNDLKIRGSIVPEYAACIPELKSALARELCA